MAKDCCKYLTVSLVPVASLTLAVLFAAGIVILPILYIHLAEEYRYAVVIDAGSTHTEMFIFRWDVPRYEGTGEIEQIFDCNIDTSLNSFMDNPMEAGGLLEPCIKQSKDDEVVVRDQRKNTYLFLGATAGMRLVRRENSTVSDLILESVNASLAKSGYRLISGRIITGQEEAVSGWITANFLSDALQDGDTLMGSLDMGGASTQIAFKHTPTQQSHEEYETSVDIFGRSHSLYARSYLCYGLTQAGLRFLAHLYNTTENKTDPISNPCLLKESLISYNVLEIFSSVCVDDDTSSEVFGFGFSQPPSMQANDTISFLGTGDAESCRRMVREVFDLTNCSQPGDCINNNYFWPPVNNSGKFLGMSAYFYVSDFFNSSLQELTSLTEYNESVQNFCRLTNATAIKIYGDGPFLQRQCFDAVYSLFILQTGFGFNSSNSWSLKFVRKVNGESVGWATGYLLNKTTNIPDDPHQVERPFQSVDLVVGIVVLSVLCLVAVVFFFVTLHACRRVLKARESYSTVS